MAAILKPSSASWSIIIIISIFTFSLASFSWEVHSLWHKLAHSYTPSHVDHGHSAWSVIVPGQFHSSLLSMICHLHDIIVLWYTINNTTTPFLHLNTGKLEYITHLKAYHKCIGSMIPEKFSVTSFLHLFVNLKSTNNCGDVLICPFYILGDITNLLASRQYNLGGQWNVILVCKQHLSHFQWISPYHTEFNTW